VDQDRAEVTINQQQEKPHMADLTKGQIRALARKYAVRVVETTCCEELPDHEWLDARLREHGCPEDQLDVWRDRVLSTPLTSVSDNAC
jgi:hypothetical protein